ncbi:lipopolysaccharide-induced tumor necrosis factor-alpha factor homolog [Musca autumnalis]|uniref:lipopolysaccharide-induced tumor necrosis factor-alpha factor homolog n=1 Tax=Musca autumnalis TaxID=221902 RepID=UPI003CEEA5C0
MSKATTPQYTYIPPPTAPPSYQEAVGGVKPVGPFTPVVYPVVTTRNDDIVTTVVPIGRTATHMICPSCHAEIETNTRRTPSMMAYISGCLLALCGCFLGCCLIPCCIDDCMEVHHTCPNCNSYLGRNGR